MGSKEDFTSGDRIYDYVEDGRIFDAHYSGSLSVCGHRVYEVAAIDVSASSQTVFHITLPIIRPQVELALIMSVIGSVPLNNF